MIWEQCIQNLNTILSKEDAARFSNNDYYYLTVIQSLNNPNFSQLAQRLQLTKPAISGMIRKLSQMGLVLKVQEEKDKRVFHVCLTEKGKCILGGDQAVYDQIAEAIREIVESDEEYKKVEKIFQKIIGVMQEKEGEVNDFLL